jgi:hypothetical protein
MHTLGQWLALILFIRFFGSFTIFPLCFVLWEEIVKPAEGLLKKLAAICILLPSFFAVIFPELKLPMFVGSTLIFTALGFWYHITDDSRKSAPDAQRSCETEKPTLMTDVSGDHALGGSPHPE